MGIADLDAMKKTLITPLAELFPVVLQPYLAKAKLYDSSCSDAAKTIYIDGEVRAYLKLDAQGKLLREKEMTNFLYKHGLAAKVLGYFGHNGKDYLLTEALDGEDGISAQHMQSPKKLAACMGEYLRLIHALPVEGCPYQHRTAEMLAESEANISRAYADKSIILEDIGIASARLTELKSCCMDEVVIHGDYCLPNIIMRDFKLQGFVDLGTGGIGDRHYDLFWGLWTLNYNFGTDKYGNCFLEAYGKEAVYPLRMELCQLLAGFTE